MSSSERRCPTLPDPGNGVVSHENRTVGSVAVYSCFAGFTIVEGDQSRMCLNDSTWDGEAGVCTGKYLDTQGIFEDRKIPNRFTSLWPTPCGDESYYN